MSPGYLLEIWLCLLDYRFLRRCSFIRGGAAIRWLSILRHCTLNSSHLWFAVPKLIWCFVLNMEVRLCRGGRINDHYVWCLLLHTYRLDLRQYFSFLLLSILISVSILWVLSILMILCSRNRSIFGLPHFLSHVDSCLVPLTLSVVFGREYFVDGHYLLSPLGWVIIIRPYQIIDVQSVFAALHILQEGLVDCLLRIAIQDVVLPYQTSRALSLLGIAAPWDKLWHWLREVIVSEGRLYQFQTKLAATVKLVVWEEDWGVLISRLRGLGIRWFVSTYDRVGRFWKGGPTGYTRRTLMLSLLQSLHDDTFRIELKFLRKNVTYLIDNFEELCKLRSMTRKYK